MTMFVKKRGWPKASFSKFKRGARLVEKDEMTSMDPDGYTDRDDHIMVHML